MKYRANFYGRAYKNSKVLCYNSLVERNKHMTFNVLGLSLLCW